MQLRINDWHHVDPHARTFRLIGSRFCEDYIENLISRDGVEGWPDRLQSGLA